METLLNNINGRYAAEKKTILALCSSHESYSIQDLAHELGTSIPKVTRVVNEMIQDEMADNLDLYVRNHEVKTTGCPSVDMVLDVCYMWIAAELGEI